MKLYLTRHGESKATIEKRFQGQFDSELTSTGLEQAKKLANRLKEYHFETIYTSPLKRAKVTTDEILKFHPNTKIIVLEELKEKDHGIYTGLLKSEIKEYVKSGEDKFSQKPPKGESHNDHIKRVEKIIREIVKENKDTLIVSHQGTLRVILHIILELDKNIALNKEKTPVSNTSLYIVEINKEERKVILENCSKHLN